MARNPTGKSSLDAAMEEARKFGASPADARRIHDIVQANTSPTVRTFELKFGSDSGNNRAVWVRLFVDEDLSPPREKISELNKIANRVRSALLRENFEFWPYVDIRGRP